MWQAYYVEFTILAIGVLVIAIRGAEYALGTAQGEEWASTANFPLTSWLGGAFGSSVETLGVIIIVLAALKIIVSMAWFLTVAAEPTMGVAWHRFLAFFNVWFQRNADGAPALGPLEPIRVNGEPIDFEKIDELPDDVREAKSHLPILYRDKDCICIASEIVWLALDCKNVEYLTVLVSKRDKHDDDNDGLPRILWPDDDDDSHTKINKRMRC